MAMIGVEIADNAIRTRVINAICGNYNWTPTVPAPVVIGEPIAPPIPNPQSKGDFATSIFKNFLREQVQAWEINQAGAVARKTARDKVEAEVTL